jgi:hypothetical protein
LLRGGSLAYAVKTALNFAIVMPIYKLSNFKILEFMIIQKLSKKAQA